MNIFSKSKIILKEITVADVDMLELNEKLEGLNLNNFFSSEQIYKLKKAYLIFNKYKFIVSFNVFSLIVLFFSKDIKTTLLIISSAFFIYTYINHKIKTLKDKSEEEILKYKEVLINKVVKNIILISKITISISSIYFLIKQFL